MYPLQFEPPSYPPSPSNPSRSSQSDRLGSLCYITVSHQLSNLHMIGYICQCYSLDSSHPLLFPLCPEDCPLHLHLYSCPSNMFISTIFLNPIYIYVSIWYLFFSFCLTSLCTTLSRSIYFVDPLGCFWHFYINLQCRLFRSSKLLFICLLFNFKILLRLFFFLFFLPSWVYAFKN